MLDTSSPMSRRVAEASPGEGRQAPENDPVCEDASRVCERQRDAVVSHTGRQSRGRGHAYARLRQHGHVLCVSERALVSPPNDELVESPFASVLIRTDASCRYKGWKRYGAHWEAI